MKKIILAVATIAVLGSAGIANAADMPAKAPVYKAPPPIALNWTGFYVGLQAGYGWSADPTYNFLGATPVDFGTDGFVGGVTGGYNWQTGALVLGVEGDISYADVKGSKTTAGIAPCLVEGCTSKLSWFGTGRLRAGYALGDFLPFITGGAAVGHVKGSADLLACGGGPVCGFDETRWGWTVGGGVEYRLADNWSVKLEYLYLNLGSPNFTSANVTTKDLVTNVVRGGINYRF